MRMSTEHVHVASNLAYRFQGCAYAPHHFGLTCSCAMIASLAHLQQQLGFVLALRPTSSMPPPPPCLCIKSHLGFGRVRETCL